MRRLLVLVCVVVVVPVAKASAEITEFPVPTANGGPLEITSGSDGALWFNEMLAGKIGRIETDGTFTEYPVPNPGSWPNTITAGPDGALWFGENRGGKIGRMTTTGTVTEFPLSPSTEYQPGIATSYVGRITAGPDGALWFTQIHRNADFPRLPNKIGRITTAGEITYFTLPGEGDTTPEGITTGPDGALWFTECGGHDESGDPVPSQIGRITTAGVLTEFPTPTPFSCPQDIAVGPDGALWFTEFFGNRIGRITTAGSITELPENPYGEGGPPMQIITGPDGALWFTMQAGGLGSVTTSGIFERYVIPTNSNTNGITIGPDGLIWFVEPTANKIGRVDVAEPFRPSVAIGGATLNEGDDGTVTAQLGVGLSGASAHTVTVDYQTSDGSASAPADYAASSGTLTFVPGDTFEFAEVAVNGDLLDEGDEDFTVTLSNPQLATIADGDAAATIFDDDPPPAISIADSPDRGEGGAASSFAVTLSAASGKQITVAYATANGTAVAPGDYAATNGTLTFDPGQTTKTVSVNSAADTLDENDETFTVGLSNPIGAPIADASGSGTILDNDPASALAIEDSPTRIEGGPAHSFRVTLSPASGRTVTVAYATQDGGAKAPGDYAAQSGTLTFAPGQTTKFVTVNSAPDAIDEETENFTVRLSSPTAATISDASGSGSIADDDPTPSLSVANAPSRVEGGPVHRFVVTLSAVSGRQVSVDYATVRGTAISPGDYTAHSGTLTFPPGQTARIVGVSNVNDSLNESNETFSLRLSRSAGASIADNLAATTIIDND